MGVIVWLVLSAVFGRRAKGTGCLLSAAANPVPHCPSPHQSVKHPNYFYLQRRPLCFLHSAEQTVHR